MRKVLTGVGAAAILAVSLSGSAGFADSVQAESERGQRDILLACQDRLFGVPPNGAETYIETTYRNGYPMLRVVEGGVVSAGAAHEINACAARHLGFAGPEGSGYVTRSNGGMMNLSAGCNPGAPKLYKGNSYCFN
ncbi:hypothetical protein [Primorskyibacter sp. 2E233]|uniref:hypothetical protein n=1 Tax=Primorskyibacter sp. 2E233 TaxID=3413431 RepID=UPI003BF1987C